MNKVKEKIEEKINIFKNIYLHKFSAKIKQRIKNPRIFAFSLVAVFVPVMILLIFFYGNFNLKGLLATISFSEQENSGETIVANKNNSDFKLNLIPKEEFLKQYNPTPAFLPRPVQLNTTFTGFLRSNSAMELLPVRNWVVDFQDIEAQSAIAIEMPTKRILYGKNVFEVRPIASITKLATALTAYKNMELDEIVTVSRTAVETEGAAGSLVIGEKLSVEQLLYALLLESSNDAGVALQEHYDENRPENTPNFVELMNIEMQEIGISDTFFEEPTGLSPNNRSSLFSIGKILYEVLENNELANVMSQPSYATESYDKNMTHYWINLNTLLEAYPGIIGGKTGYTDEAGPSMAIISTTPNSGRYLVVGVLNASDRVEQTTKLFKWVKDAYIWEE